MVNIWNASSGEGLHKFVGLSYDVHSVAFSRDSTRLASASKSMVNIWNVSSGELLQTFSSNYSLGSVASSHDATQLALATVQGSVDDRCVEIWDASSGEHLH